MSDLDALLAGIVADPHEHVRWLIVADWLDDHGFADRAELLRLHRMLIDTCCEPDQHPDRAAWQARIVELIDAGVTPCVPQHTVMLPGGVPLVGNFIPPGSFLMGSNDGEDYEKPVRKVTITNGFFMGIHPVTQRQWKAVMGENPSEFEGDHRPVENHAWTETLDFCSAACVVAGGFAIRLPTEAEWEYACRAGTTTRFHYGEQHRDDKMNHDGYALLRWSGRGPMSEQTSDVGTFAANPWGLFDCHGNVWEWCADWYEADFYSRSAQVDPICQTEGEFGFRVLRGGAWCNSHPDCRSAARHGYEPGACVYTQGFRVAFTLS